MKCFSKWGLRNIVTAFDQEASIVSKAERVRVLACCNHGHFGFANCEFSRKRLAPFCVRKVRKIPKYLGKVRKGQIEAKRGTLVE